MTVNRKCIVCDGPIPAARGERATTCCKEHSAIREKAKPSAYQPVPDRRIYDYPETEYKRAIQRLGWNQTHSAKMLGIDPRTSGRYISGDLAMPSTLRLLLRVLVSLKRTEEWFLEATREPIQ